MSGRRTLSEIFTVVREPSLEPGPKALWVLYRSYDGKGRGAFPGDERVAEHLGVSPRTVQRWRSELIAPPGYLRQKLDGPKPARYHAVIPKRDDTRVESSPEEETTPVSDQAGERDDTPFESLTEDTTSDATSDATQVAPHSSTDEYFGFLTTFGNRAAA